MYGGTGVGVRLSLFPCHGDANVLPHTASVSGPPLGVRDTTGVRDSDAVLLGAIDTYRGLVSPLYHSSIVTHFNFLATI